MEEIVQQAEELDAGLIVVGSRRTGRLGRLVMGSVSTGLAHRSSRPVLILGEGAGEWPPGRVLVGYGSFEDTEKAGLLGASIGRAHGAGTELIGLVGEADAVETGARLREMERTLAARGRHRGRDGRARARSPARRRTRYWTSWPKKGVRPS